MKKLMAKMARQKSGEVCEVCNGKAHVKGVRQKSGEACEVCEACEVFAAISVMKLKKATAGNEQLL